MIRPSLFRRLADDERGISAVEFAMLAPVLILFYMGMTEFCAGFMAQKRMSHVTSMVADLVAQEKSVTPDNLDDIFDIGGLIMKPFPTATLKLRITSVTRTGGVDKVDWSYGDGIAPLAKGATFTVPAGLVTEGQSLVVSEATYDYDSASDYLMPGLTRFERSYFLRPRHVDVVECDDC
jgi:Flp pilus assembly protein TadG